MKYDNINQKYTGAGNLSTKVSYSADTSSKATLGDPYDALSGNKLDSADKKEKAQSVINLLSKRVNVYKNAFNKVSAACLKEAKFYIAQDRMLVAKAVAYRPKNESTELVSQGEMDFFGDIAAWEVETDLR